MPTVLLGWFPFLPTLCLLKDQDLTIPIILGIASYFLGSIPTGYLLARSRGINIREVGSGNIGATNVARALGRKMAVATFFGDTLKGLIPVLISQALHLGLIVTGVIGFIAFLGHVYPIFLRFKGGKGVATAFGAVLGIAPIVALITLGVWLTVFFTTRTSSLSALAGMVILPILIVTTADPRNLYFIIPLIAFLIFNHRENIQRLFQGTESKFK